MRIVRGEGGQGLMLAIMCLGVIMAGVVLFGNDRSRAVGNLAEKLDTSQSAFEALNAAAKRVQNIYSSESGCDPIVLSSRLSRLSSLPASAVSLGTGTNSTYATAQPNLTDPAARYNRCTAGSGCRQIAIPIDNIYYIVTIGAVSRADPIAARVGMECPRDASVKLSVAVNGNVYYQSFTLTNLCTLASCNCVTGSCPASEAAFSNINLTSSASLTTSACTGGASNILSRYYGSLVGSSNSTISTNDLRWARTYIETGAGGSGETSYIFNNNVAVANYTSGSFSVTNGACAPLVSAGQCVSTPCFPSLDLNRDFTNNETDIAILEHYLRGYLTTLPVNELN